MSLAFKDLTNPIGGMSHCSCMVVDNEGIVSVWQPTSHKLDFVGKEILSHGSITELLLLLVKFETM